MQAALRLWHTAKTAYAHCFRSRLAYVSEIWELHDFEEGVSHYADTREELPEMYENKVLLHHTRRDAPDFVDHRVAVHWGRTPRDAYRIRDLYDSPIPPWYYIGCITGEGLKTDYTTLLAPFIVEGNKITPALLNVISGTEGRWVYLDKTFNQVDFPSNGIIIVSVHGDDTNPDIPSESRQGGMEIQ